MPAHTVIRLGSYRHLPFNGSDIACCHSLYLRVMFTVDDIDEALERLRRPGAQIAGEVVDWDVYRLCYIREPEGLLNGLAQELGGALRDLRSILRRFDHRPGAEQQGARKTFRELLIDGREHTLRVALVSRRLAEIYEADGRGQLPVQRLLPGGFHHGVLKKVVYLQRRSQVLIPENLTLSPQDFRDHPVVAVLTRK
ncbi:hypothetical conserved protein (plasmid) [Rhizobium etli CFN 42]|uniref:Hypothetical conserved protein n=1 Tax=Rhizobium etli (strain ATCC 51251 / DSM 11541 / JCM 21823 / NBRC 15573 / CFN 42) TaxID=347834 RepID=Q2JYB6_RHIEC|nr:hypothetical conserved protein [Rhizobium etli CFN 42]